MTDVDIRRKWREKGFLLPLSNSKKWCKDFKISRWILHLDVHWSCSGGWDDMTDKGNVYTSHVSFRKWRTFVSEHEIKSFSQIVLYKLCITWFHEEIGCG